MRAEEHPNPQADIEQPHPEAQDEPSQHAPPPLVGGEPEEDLVLSILLQGQTHDLVDAAEDPDDDGLVPGGAVDLQGGAGVVGGGEEGERAVDVD